MKSPKRHARRLGLVDVVFDVDVFAGKAHKGAGGCLGSLRVGDEPLVPGPQEPVLRAAGVEGGLIGVGAPGQGHGHPEALFFIQVPSVHLNPSTKAILEAVSGRSSAIFAKGSAL